MNHNSALLSSVISAPFHSVISAPFYPVISAPFYPVISAPLYFPFASLCSPRASRSTPLHAASAHSRFGARGIGARSNRLSWGSDPMRLRSSHRAGGWWRGRMMRPALPPPEGRPSLSPAPLGAYTSDTTASRPLRAVRRLAQQRDAQDFLSERTALVRSWSGCPTLAAP